MMKPQYLFVAVLSALTFMGCENADHQFQLGTEFFMAKDYSRAEQHYVKALQIYSIKDSGNHYIIGKTYSRLGSLYILTGEWMAAETQILFAIDEFKQVRDLGITELVDAYLTLGRIAVHKGDIESGKVYLNQAISLTKKTGDIKLLAIIHVSLGNMCANAGEVGEALNSFRAAKALYLQAGMNSMIDELDKTIESLSARQPDQ